MVLPKAPESLARCRFCMMRSTWRRRLSPICTDATARNGVDHQPSRQDQIDSFQTSDFDSHLFGGLVKVNLKFEIGQFGLIVRVGGIHNAFLVP